ncbi:MAG: hypothetical protein ACRDOL_29795 [Streptosporangiaceae bacterium]
MGDRSARPAGLIGQAQSGQARSGQARSGQARSDQGNGSRSGSTQPPRAGFAARVDDR